LRHDHEQRPRASAHINHCRGSSSWSHKIGKTPSITPTRIGKLLTPFRHWRQPLLSGWALTGACGQRRQPAAYGGTLGTVVVPIRGPRSGCLRSQLYLPRLTSSAAAATSPGATCGRASAITPRGFGSRSCPFFKYVAASSGAEAASCLAPCLFSCLSLPPSAS